MANQVGGFKCGAMPSKASLKACWLLIATDLGRLAAAGRGIAEGAADLLPTGCFQHSIASRYSFAEIISSQGFDLAGCGADVAYGLPSILTGWWSGLLGVLTMISGNEHRLVLSIVQGSKGLCCCS